MNKKAYRAGQCDGLLGRAANCPYRQHWLATEYLRGFTDGAEYRKINNITLEA